MIEKTGNSGRRYQNRALVRDVTERFLTLVSLVVIFSFIFRICKPISHELMGIDRTSEGNLGSRPYMDRREPTLEPSQEHLHVGANAMVVCDVPLCSKMGAEVLKRGGNAADSVVTVALCIGSVNSYASGIGGGGFIVSSLNSSGEVITINARETAPKKAHKHMFASNPLLSQIGGLAVAVPGELKGIYELYKRHGSGNLKWSDLIQPVIELNEEGFKVSEVLSFAIETIRSKILPSNPEVVQNWDFIYKEDGSLATINDTIRRSSFAESLRLIAKNGSSDIFYDPEGPFVKSLVETANSLGGVLSKEDFADYDIRISEALEFNLTIRDKVHRIFTSGEVSSGLALVAGLNIFDKLYNESSSELLQVHRLIEGMKWIASARSRLGDLSKTSSHQKYFQDISERYTSEEWPEEVIATGNYSDKSTFPWQHYKPLYQLTEPHGTSHISVVDKDGNAVGMTTTINLTFGSMVYDNNTGIILNNQMDDFSQPNTRNAFNLSPSIFNFVEPGKRPQSSTSPTIIMTETHDGKFLPDLVIGAAGGSHIVTAVFQGIVRIYYYQLSLLDTIAFPRSHHQLIPEYIMSENVTIFSEEHRSSSNIVSEMEHMGHSILETGPHSNMNGIKRKDVGSESYQWEGVGDYWRKLAEAYGY